MLAYRGQRVWFYRSVLCAGPPGQRFCVVGADLTRLVDVPYATRPVIPPDTSLRRFLGEHVGLSGQPVRVYELRRPHTRRRHDGRLRKRGR